MDMIADLELMDNDVAPCATAEKPKDAIHSMQLLHNILEDHGTQTHIEFGTAKCKLLISAHPAKLGEVEKLFQDEPGILTTITNQVIWWRISGSYASVVGLWVCGSV